jgi:hypothetical protein
MGTQEHVYDVQAGTQEQAGAIRTDLPATARGLLRGGGDSTHFIPCRYVSSCPPKPAARVGPHLGVGRVGVSLDKLGQSSV